MSKLFLSSYVSRKIWYSPTWGALGNLPSAPQPVVYVCLAERPSVDVVGMPSVSRAFAFPPSSRLLPLVPVLWILHCTFERRSNGRSRIYSALGECGGSTRVTALCQWMNYFCGLVEEPAASLWQSGPMRSARILGNVYQVLDIATLEHRW